jgi:hypothetical protein
MTVDREKLRQWLDAQEMRDLPDFGFPWVRPRYAQTTIQQRIEPYATQYDDLARDLPWFEDGEPDPEFYQPTPRLLALEAQLDDLRTQGFREVPNPDYDDDRARAWEAKWVRPYNAATIEVGQSSHPEDSHD